MARIYTVETRREFTGGTLVGLTYSETREIIARTMREARRVARLLDGLHVPQPIAGSPYILRMTSPVRFSRIA